MKKQRYRIHPAHIASAGGTVYYEIQIMGFWGWKRFLSSHILSLEEAIKIKKELEQLHKYEESCAKKEKLDEEKVQAPNIGRQDLL